MNSINFLILFFSPVLRVCSSDWTRKSVSMSLPGGGQETTGNSRTGTALALTHTGQGSPAPPPSPPAWDWGPHQPPSDWIIITLSSVSPVLQAMRLESGPVWVLLIPGGPGLTCRNRFSHWPVAVSI